MNKIMDCKFVLLLPSSMVVLDSNLGLRTTLNIYERAFGTRLQYFKPLRELIGVLLLCWSETPQ